MKCISCHFTGLSSFLKISNAPRCVQVINKSSLGKDKKIDIEILKCERCTMVQLSDKNYVISDYYDDYIMSRTHSTFSKKYQNSLAKMFIDQFNLKNKSIVDIGCGDGFFAQMLEKNGAKAIGIEPSETAFQQAKARNIQVIKAYVNDNFNIKRKFDGFVACQVFEHISDPGNMLKNIKKFIKEESFGLIEVPSLVKAMKDSRFYDFFPDHVAYYSPTSLAYMLQLNGFDVISVQHTANDEYITAFIRFTNRSGLTENFQQEFYEYKKEFSNFFNKLANKKIILWGAGAKGISSLSFSDVNPKNILFCIDSDPNKEGRYLPGSHIQVVSPSVLDKTKADIIIVTAMMYKDEIISKLEKKYHYKKNQIAIIAPKPHFLK